MYYNYAQVLVDIEAVDKRTFSYKIPEELLDIISIGMAVLVPFGNRPYLVGYVVGFSEKPPVQVKMKSILQVLGSQPLFDLEFLKFLEWISDYYCCSLTSALASALPQGLWVKTQQIVSLKQNNINLTTLEANEITLIKLLQENKKGVLSLKTILQKAKSLRLDGHKVINTLTQKGLIDLSVKVDSPMEHHKIEKYIHKGQVSPQSKRQQEILDCLQQIPAALTLQEACKQVACTETTLKKMIEQEILSVKEITIYRTPLGKYQRIEKDVPKQLNVEQQVVYDQLIHNYNNHITDPVLIHGVTGSGKTEIYMQVMEKLIQDGKSIIFLLPEITLASHITLRILSRFNQSQIALWHSTLSGGERIDSWSRIQSGEAKIIIGTRSAIFTPAHNLGMIIIDECNDSSYKQDSQNPRYNAVTLAEERAKRFGALCVLGTATPNAETFYQCLQAKKIYTLHKRATKQQLPSIHVVNMKEETAAGNRSILARYTLHNIQTALDHGQQTIILVNRRGFSTYTSCATCSYVEECPHCTISLVYHNSTQKLRCHYCNFTREPVQLCPNCGGRTIRNYGVGTQRVEEEVKNQFREACIIRLDSDVTANKNIHNKILEDFSNGQGDILIGTQMIAKGLDIPNVTLVVVVSVDSILTMPDFRADERGFQLLTQIAGRAGRGDIQGQVIFQAYDTDNEIIQYVQNQDYAGFYDREIDFREHYFYPPFSQIIRILVSSEEPSDAIASSIDIFKALKQAVETQGLQEHIEVYQPVSCVIAKISNRYRMHVMMKNRMHALGRNLINRIYKNFKFPDHVRASIDIDPLNLL